MSHAAEPVAALGGRVACRAEPGASQDTDLRLRNVADVAEPLYETPYVIRELTIADPVGNELGFVAG